MSRVYFPQLKRCERSRHLYTAATRKPEQQRFTMRSGLLTSISSRQRSAIIGRPLPERKNFGSAVCS